MTSRTAPIGALWPEWWPLPQPLAAPESPRVTSYDEELVGPAMDATLRPRDVDSSQGWKRGRAVTLEEVPPYPLGLNPWARPRATLE